jgi:phosphomannomutase
MREPISFGTEGWRALLADDYTFDTVRAVARAAAKWFQQQPRSAAVAVGHDTRFLGNRFAAAVADELAEVGVEVRLCAGPLPTPAVGVYVVENKLAGSVVLTASHNPAEYNGVKVKGSTAGSVPEEDAKWIEAEANRMLSEDPEKRAPAREHQRFDVRDRYLDGLVSKVDRRAIQRAKLVVVADMMHGAGGGYLDEALRRAGCAEVRPVRANPDPTFGWRRPEPIGENLVASTAMTADPAVTVGLATDGDADRFGLMAHGEYLDVMQAIVLILYHLLKNRHYQGSVVHSLNVTSMVARLCQHYGSRVIETPVGFKNIAPKLVGDSDYVFAAEESGGFAIRGHIPDRDGTAAALTVCEAIATEGKPVREILADIFSLVGGRRYYERLDMKLTAGQHEKLAQAMPTLERDSVAGERVVGVGRMDGAKFSLSDGSWLLLRLSGTEPLVRIYAETVSEEEVRKLLAAGRDLVTSVTGG